MTSVKNCLPLTLRSISIFNRSETSSGRTTMRPGKKRMKEDEEEEEKEEDKVDEKKGL